MEAPINKNYGRSLKKSIHRTFSSTPCENLAPINYQNGILQTPPILYHSFPPFLAHKKQPPLLPLPISKSNVHKHYNNHINTLSQNRAFSLPSTNRKVNKNVKSKKSSPKKEQLSPKSSKVALVSSTNHLGPDPKDLPKDVSMVLSLSTTGGKEQSVDALSSRYSQNLIKDDANRNQLSLLHVICGKKQSADALNSGNVDNSIKDDVNRNQLSILRVTSEKELHVSAVSSRDAQNLIKELHTHSFKEIIDCEVNKFSGSVVFTTVSPPPSSLPLPTFSLRPKLSCNAEASAGVDAGATDNLRRLLRLR